MEVETSDLWRGLADLLRPGLLPVLPQRRGTLFGEPCMLSLCYEASGVVGIFLTLDPTGAPFC